MIAKSLSLLAFSMADLNTTAVAVDVADGNCIFRERRSYAGLLPAELKGLSGQ